MAASPKPAWSLLVRRALGHRWSDMDEVNLRHYRDLSPKAAATRIAADVRKEHSSCRECGAAIDPNDEPRFCSRTCGNAYHYDGGATGRKRGHAAGFDYNPADIEHAHVQAAVHRAKARTAAARRDPSLGAPMQVILVPRGKNPKARSASNLRSGDAVEVQKIWAGGRTTHKAWFAGYRFVRWETAKKQSPIGLATSAIVMPTQGLYEGMELRFSPEDVRPC